MSEPSTKSRMSPRRWHLATWILLLLWMITWTTGNYPHNPPAEEMEVTRPALVMPRAYNVRSVSGFPIFYVERDISFPARKVSTTVHYHYLAVNVAALIASLISIVYCLQRIGQFSIRSMLAGIAFVAVVIVGGKSIGELYDGFAVYYYVIGIFCLPILAAVVIAIATKVVRRRES